MSNFDVEQLRQIQQIAPVETFQPQYSLIERDVEAQIPPYALQEHIGVIVYSPMGSGLLAGGMSRERIESMADDDWRARDLRFQEPQLSRMPSTVRSSASVGPIRLTRSSSLPTSNSAPRTQPKSKGAHDES